MSTIPAIFPKAQPFPRIRLILVVEHDVDFGVILVQMIKQKTRYKTILATNVIEALKMACNFKCDLFLLDYQLPDIHGFELYDQLHSAEGYEETPALFLSGNTFLERPFTGLAELETLLGTIQNLLDPESEDFTLLSYS
jgi:CheY-like chemotaxis protein